ncbi:MAG: Rieske (2Fe-2S) protein [Bryobacteraceae bacterium]|nr:Rieske (2Fe-2S) protein [Bryobacteraceae bacterium]
MSFIRVGSLASLAPGQVTEVDVAGKQYALCNIGGELHALEGTCPHQGGPLGQGALHEEILVCPWHAWEYDCRTGENTWDADTKLQKFPVKIEGDDILIDLP